MIVAVALSPPVRPLDSTGVSVARTSRADVNAIIASRNALRRLERRGNDDALE